MPDPVPNDGGANHHGLHALQPVAAAASVVISPEGKLISSPARSGSPLDRGPFCTPPPTTPFSYYGDGDSRLPPSFSASSLPDLSSSDA